MELILNHTTLFYYNISTTKTSKTNYGPVANWATQVAKAAGAKHSHSLPRTVSSTTAANLNSRTTSSSNAIVISSKTKIAKHESNHHHAGPSDDFSEDEHEERKVALSSPIKGGTRLSSAVQYTHAHLPNGCQDNGAWHRIFIPTYLKYLASRDSDAWAVNDDEGVSIQQKIWDFVYGDMVPHIITVHGPVFALIDQRVCEWRNGFASAALSIVNAFFDDNEYDSDKCRQEFAKSALESWEFLFRDISTTKDGKKKRKGIFGGAFVVLTFTVHFTATQGAINVPSIGDLSHGPFAALALSAAAVERALTLWKDGSVSCESTNMTDFNQENWAKITNSYLSSIKKALSSASKFDPIINDAKRFVKATSQTEDTTSSTAFNNTSAEEDMDERAFLCDNEDSDQCE